ncbi:hypothetical protein D3C86_2260620 [compost metagenome]
MPFLIWAFSAAVMASAMPASFFEATAISAASGQPPEKVPTSFVFFWLAAWKAEVALGPR